MGYGALSSSPDGNSGSNAVLGTFALANRGNQCVAIGTYAGVQDTAIAGIGGVYVGYRSRIFKRSRRGLRFCRL